MLSHSISFRVRYGETDQMGFVYYGNYALYFEIGRVETMRTLDISYKDLEMAGIGMPVRHMEITYKSAATYDELITVRSEIHETPDSRLEFHHIVYGHDNRLICKGLVVLSFIDMAIKKSIRCPDWVKDNISYALQISS